MMTTQELKDQLDLRFTYKIDFDAASHVYKIGTDKKVFPSVTGFIKNFHKFFDAPAVAHRMAQRSSKTTDEILAEWEENRIRSIMIGNKAHDFAEGYFEDMIPQADPNYGTFTPESYRELAVVEFAMNLPSKYYIVAAEQRMFTEQYEYAGTADLILLNQETNKLVIVDWKTNKDLFKNYGDMLYHPFEDYINCPLYKYFIQLSFYQIMLEDAGFEVEERWVVHLANEPKFEGESYFYKKYPTPDLSERIRLHLHDTSGKAWREKQITE